MNYRSLRRPLSALSAQEQDALVSAMRERRLVVPERRKGPSPTAKLIDKIKSLSPVDKAALEYCISKGGLND